MLLEMLLENELSPAVTTALPHGTNIILAMRVANPQHNRLSPPPPAGTHIQNLLVFRRPCALLAVKFNVSASPGQVACSRDCRHVPFRNKWNKRERESRYERHCIRTLQPRKRLERLRLRGCGISMTRTGAPAWRGWWQRNASLHVRFASRRGGGDRYRRPTGESGVCAWKCWLRCSRSSTVKFAFPGEGGTWVR